MISSPASSRALSLLLAGALALASFALSAQEPPAPLGEAIERALESAIGAPDPATVDDWPLYAACLGRHERLEPLLERLEEIADYPDEDEEKNESSSPDGEESEDGDAEPATPPPLAARTQAARWLSARLHWRYGLLGEARKRFEDLHDRDLGPLATFRLAQLTDSLGDTGAAVELYREIVAGEADVPAELAEKASLRLAILKSSGSKIEDLDDLKAFAGGRDADFGNRAAVILALAGKPKDALELYRVDAESKAAFKQEMRVAEWALEAKDLERAREAAWRARGLAKLKRDRRYALTVLAEAYRLEKKLSDLIARFEKEEGLDEESRESWIELLRETGEVETALKLFRERGGEDGFPVDMRRELLEICREAEREDLLVENYESMIRSEPRRIEWRAGLARYRLETGEREAALEIWKDFSDGAEPLELLGAAAATDELGLDELVVDFAETAIERAGEDSPLTLQALHFLFGFHRSRNREDEVSATLTRLDALAAPGASERVQLAEAWEQIGRHDRAAATLEGLREARGAANFSADLETRLAWLYSEMGAEEKAYDRWRSVWLRIESPGRRRYIEDRLMATASRLGRLADIAIELEEKLLEGRATPHDAALLVRLYTRVSDPVSAAEITEEYLRQSGEGEIRLLEEKARIYVLCNDYYHYEKTLRRLIELDPEGTAEYLTQLAMSALERGRNDQAREILLEMRGLESNPAAAEFEAGVLKIAGLHEESARAYFRGTAEQPGRIDAYLLLGRALQTINRGAQAIGLFQYHVETAAKDDLFTIAVDGLLNARAGRPVLQWARRLILERLAEREDKIYLFQLVSDVAEDLRDTATKRRALAEILPVAGEQRTSFLRELMELAKTGARSGSFFSTSRSANFKSRDDLLRYGRRLVGMGELVPPQIYLDLGQAFLESDDVRNAMKTFERADETSDHIGYYRKVGQTFEQKRFARSALRVYEKLLVSSGHDVTLLMKVAELREQLGRDDDAGRGFGRAIDLALESQPLWTGEKLPETSQRGRYSYYYARNVGVFEKHRERLLRGLFATTPPGETLEAFLAEQFERLERDLARIDAESDEVLESPETVRLVARHPRVERRAEIIRRLGFAQAATETVRRLDALLLEAFPGDAGLLEDVVASWKRWGRTAGARELVERSAEHAGFDRVRSLLEGGTEQDAREIFTALVAGDDRAALGQLREATSIGLEKQSRASRDALRAAALYLGDAPALEALLRRELILADSTIITTGLSLLSNGLHYLSEDRREALVEWLVSRVESRGARISAGQWYSVGRLRELVGRPIRIPVAVMRERIFETIGRGGAYLYYLGGYFSVLEPEEYGELLGEVFAKAKTADRLRLLVELVAAYQGDMPEDLSAKFIELASGVEADLKSNPLYRFTSPYQEVHGGGIEFLERFLLALSEAAPEEQRSAYDGARAMVLYRAGEHEKALPIAEAIYRQSIAGKVEGIDRNSLGYIQSILVQNHPARFIAVIDAVAEEKGESVELERKRVAIANQSGDVEQLLTSLRRAIERHPDDKKFHTQLSSQLRSLGRPVEALGVLEDLLERTPADAALRNQVIQGWRALQHPLRAEAVQAAAPPPDSGKKTASARASGLGGIPLLAQLLPSWATRVLVAAPPQVQVRGATAASPVAPAGDAPAASEEEAETEEKAEEKEKKLEPATIALLKKQHDAEKPDEARQVLRRLWRQFEQLDNQYFSYARYSYSRSSRHLWPAPPAPPAPKPPPPPPGGLRRHLHDARQALERSKRPRPRREHALVALASSEFSREEARRWLSSLPAGSSGQDFEALVESLARAELEGQEPAEAFAPLLEALEQDRLDRTRRLVILKMAELRPEHRDERLDRGLERILATVDRGDTESLLALARCHADRERPEIAARLYRWCAARRSGDLNALLDAAVEHLEGELRDATVAAILRLREVVPLRSSGGANPSHDLRIISTWARLVPVTEVLSRCPDTLRSAVSRHRSTSRNVLVEATRYLAAGGAIEEALEALSATVTWKPTSTMVRIYDPTFGGYYYTSTRNSRGADQIPAANLRLWFPDDLATWKDAGAWLEAAARRLHELHGEGALRAGDAVRALSLIAHRQIELDRPEAATATLRWLEDLRSPRSDHALWVSDALRTAGRDADAAAVEGGLLEDGQLLVDRIGELVRWIAESRSREEALAISEAAAEFTHHPDLLASALEVASALGAPGDVARWEDRLVQLILRTSNPEPFGHVVTVGGASRLYRHEELDAATVIQDTLGGEDIVVYYDRADRRAYAHRAGRRRFEFERGAARDENGEAWDLTVGKMAIAEAEPFLDPLPARPRSIAQWRRSHPGGEVYLVSDLEDATWIIPRGAGGWRFDDGEKAPPASWTLPGFDDSRWVEAKAPLGYGDDDIAGVISFGDDPQKKRLVAWFRRRLEISREAGYVRFIARVRADDGAVLHVNGREVRRFNVAGGAVNAQTTATGTATEGQWDTVLLDPRLFRPGENVVALSVHQANPTSSDLALDLELGALPPAGQREKKSEGKATEKRTIEPAASSSKAMPIRPATPARPAAGVRAIPVQPARRLTPAR